MYLQKYYNNSNFFSFCTKNYTTEIYYKPLHTDKVFYFLRQDYFDVRIHKKCMHPFSYDPCSIGIKITSPISDHQLPALSVV